MLVSSVRVWYQARQVEYISLTTSGLGEKPNLTCSRDESNEHRRGRPFPRRSVARIPCGAVSGPYKAQYSLRSRFCEAALASATCCIAPETGFVIADLSGRSISSKGSCEMVIRGSGPLMARHNGFSYTDAGGRPGRDRRRRSGSISRRSCRRNRRRCRRPGRGRNCGDS